MNTPIVIKHVTSWRNGQLNVIMKTRKWGIYSCITPTLHRNWRGIGMFYSNFTLEGKYVRLHIECFREIEEFHTVIDFFPCLRIFPFPWGFTTLILLLHYSFLHWYWKWWTTKKSSARMVFRELNSMWMALYPAFDGSISRFPRAISWDFPHTKLDVL